MAVTATLGTIVSSTSSGTTANVIVPASSVGEISVLSCSGNIAATASFLTPAGWQVLTTSTTPNNTGTFTHANFYRVYQAGDPSTVTVTLSTTGSVGPGGRIQIIPFKLGGADTSNPFEEQGVTASGTITAGSSIPAPARTATLSRFLVTTHSLKTALNDGAAQTMTAPSGMTAVGSADTNQAGFNNVVSGVYRLVLSGAGATGTKNATSSADGQAVSASFLVNAGSALTQGVGASIATTNALSSSTEAATKVQYLKDDFSIDRLATLWPISTAGVNVTGGVGVIPTDTVSGNSAMRTNFIWSLKNSFLQCGMDAPIPTGATQAWGRLMIRPNLTGLNLQIRADNATGLIYFENRDAASANITDPSDTGVSSMTRDSTAMHYLQIAESGGRVVFQTSPDGTNWTTRRSVVTPSWVTDTPNLRVDITAFKNAGAASVINIDNVGLLGIGTTIPDEPPPSGVEPDPTPTGGSSSGASGFTKVVTETANLTHYYPLDNQAQNLTSDGKPADIWGRASHNGYTHADYIGPNVTLDSTGATFNGTSSSYIKIPHNNDFSVASPENGGPTSGAMTIVVFVTVSNWHNTTNGTEYMHWMGKGTYNNSGLTGREDPVDSLEWGTRHYISPPNSGEAPGRPGRTSVYHWPGDGGTGNGAYIEGGLNNVPSSFQYSTQEFMFTARMDAGSRDDINAWWNNINSNTQSINNGTNTSWGGPHTMYTGAVRLGRMGQYNDNSGYFIGRLRRLMFFKGFIPDATVTALYNSRLLAEGALGGSIIVPVAPGPIQELTLSSTNTSITAVWRPPATAGTQAISNYDITLTAPGQLTQTTTIVNNADAASRTKTFTNLVSGVTYTMSVTARSNAGSSAATTSDATTNSLVPSQPIALGVASVNNGLNLSWTRPASDGGSPITGYTVQYALTSGTTTATTDTFGVNKLMQDMTGGQKWEASWNTVRSFTGQDPQDPWFDADHGNGSYRTSAGQLFISGSVPRMYVYNPNNTSQWRDVEITMYFKRMADTSNAYDGMEAMARTRHTPDSNSCDTRGVSARMRVDGHVDFEKETAHPNSTTVANKTIWSGSAGGGLGGSLPYNTWIGYKYLVYDLSNGNVKLELWMDTTDGLNGGTWTKINEFTDDGTNMGVGGTPCAVGVDPKLRLTKSGTRSNSESGLPNQVVYFRSDNVSTDGLVYKKGSVREIDPTATGGVLTWTSVNLPATDRSYSITGLTNGSPYSVRVVANNALGTSSPATGSGTPANTATAPLAPTAVQTVPGNASVVATWGPPIGDGGSPVLDYTITINGPTTQTKTSSVRTVSFNGLTNGGAYTVTVSARNAVGTGPSTTSSSFSPFELPSAPTNVSGTAGNGIIDVAWSAPTTPGTGGVTSYSVVAKLPNGSVATSVDTTSGGRSTTLTGLNNGTTYTIEVRAVSSFGTSPPSSFTSTPVAPVIVAPSAPINFEHQPGVSGAINLSWAAPTSNGGEPISGYNLVAKKTSTGEIAQTQSYASSTLSDTITGLTNGTLYTFTITAFNSAGNGLEASVQDTPVLPAGPPGAVTGVTAVALNENTVTISWSPPITGSTVDHYEVSALPLVPVQTVPGTDTSVTMTGLAPSTAYTFTIVGMNLYGGSTAATTTITTPAHYVPPPFRLPVPNMFAFPQPTATDPPRIFRPANFGKTIEEVEVGD
jgi:hypothetical protein